MSGYTQDYGYYAGGGGGGGGQGARVYQNVQRGFNGGNDFFGEPTTPQYGSRPSSQRRNNDESEFSPGLLDLHSFDTELLPEVGVHLAPLIEYLLLVDRVETHYFHQTIFSKTSFEFSV